MRNDCFDGLSDFVGFCVLGSSDFESFGGSGSFDVFDWFGGFDDFDCFDGFEQMRRMDANGVNRIKTCSFS